MLLLRESRDNLADGWMCVVGRDLEWRRRTDLLLLWIRVNSSDMEGSSSGAFREGRDDGSCVPGVEEEGASYSTSVGRPNAVINAEETIGEAYRFGSGSSSVAGVFCFFGLPNVE